MSDPATTSEEAFGLEPHVDVTSPRMTRVAPEFSLFETPEADLRREAKEEQLRTALFRSTSFWDLVRDSAERMGIETYREFHELSGLPLSACRYGWDFGHRYPDQETIDRCARVLGVTSESLFEWEPREKGKRKAPKCR